MITHLLGKQPEIEAKRVRKIGRLVQRRIEKFSRRVK